MSEPEQRKLAAIMFTDIVGYSALTQRDKKLTLELLVEHFNLVRALLPSYQGNEIKTIGDAFLVQFRHGGICITEDVARQIRNKVEYLFHQVGERTLENMEFPISVYRVDLPWLKPKPGKGAPEEAKPAKVAAHAAGKTDRAALRGGEGVGRLAFVQLVRSNCGKEHAWNGSDHLRERRRF